MACVFSFMLPVLHHFTFKAYLAGISRICFYERLCSSNWTPVGYVLLIFVIP